MENILMFNSVYNTALPFILNLSAEGWRTSCLFNYEKEIIFFSYWEIEKALCIEINVQYELLVYGRMWKRICSTLHEQSEDTPQYILKKYVSA